MTAGRRSRLFPITFPSRLFAFEFVCAAVAVAILVAVALIVRARLLEVAPDPACLRAQWLSEPLSGCRDAAEYARRLGEETEGVMAAFGIVPLLVAALLGSIAGARDLDEGAAPLAWSLYVSRGRWLVERLSVVLVVVVAASIISMLAAQQLADARILVTPAGETFRDYGLFSIPLLMRSLGVLHIALLIGIVVGRQLPTLLLACGIAFATPILLAQAMPFGEPVSAVNAPQHQATAEARLGLDFWGDQKWQDTAGSLYTEEEALATSPNPSDYAARIQWLDDNFDQVDLVIAGSRRGSVELREAGLLGVITAAAAVGAWLVVRRRKPY